MFSAKKVSVFLKELDIISRENSNFLDYPLLYKIRDIFEYEMISLSSYDQTHFKGIKAIGTPKAYSIKENYIRYFQKRDPFAAYINTVCDQKENTTLIQSSRVFSDNYTDNEYYKYLNNYGFAWSLAVPIGSYRLTVYKQNSENDFSNQELQEMELIATIIKDKYNTLRSISIMKTIEENENSILDSLGIGVIVLNEHLEIQKCSKNATSFLGKFHNESGVQEACYYLYNLLTNYGAKEQNSNFPVYLELENHKYSLDLSVKNSSFSNEQYYIITVRQFQILKYPKSIKHDLTAWNNLTQREYEICSQIASGSSYQGIADNLFISINTVRTHIRNAYKKLGINNQRELAKMLR